MLGWIINEEKGDLIISLPLIFLFFIIMVGVVKITHLVTVNDVIFNKTIATATRSAANQFYLVGIAEEVEEEEEPIVNIYPEISPFNAKETFEKILRSNLKLDGNLESKHNSPLEGPIRYTLLICTGGSTDNILYHFTGGQLTIENLPSSGFPQSFVVEGQPVIFMEPGVFCIVEATAKPIIGKPTPIKQSAKASVKFINDQWVATNS